MIQGNAKTSLKKATIADQSSSASRIMHATLRPRPKSRRNLRWLQKKKSTFAREWKPLNPTKGPSLTITARRSVSAIMPTEVNGTKSKRGNSSPGRPVDQNKVGFVADEKSRIFRQQFESTIQSGKVFTMDTPNNTIRGALLKRGWIERDPRLKYDKHESTERPHDASDSKSTHVYADVEWTRQNLAQVTPTFIWTLQHRSRLGWNNLQPNQIVNQHPNGPFTTKIGLATCLRNSHWTSEKGIGNTLFPRCYHLRDIEQRRVFVSDYRLTATIGLLQFVVGNCELRGFDVIFDPKGRVPSSCVDFAIRQVHRYIRLRKHHDFDRQLTSSDTGLSQFQDFLSRYYDVVMLKEKLMPSREVKEHPKKLYEMAKGAVEAVAPFWPQLQVDGTSNVWVCTPGVRRRGQGTVLENQLESILRLVTVPERQAEDWFVQKYIERPHLMYGSKFDIRQWFLVSSWDPLTVWMYKECYMRICSEPFSMDNLRETAHFCNFCGRRYGQKASTNPQDLPIQKNGFWDSSMFRGYLKSIGKAGLWESVIYPGMRKSMLGLLLSAYESVEVRPNSFEIYTADFVLSEDFTPWLLQVHGPGLTSFPPLASKMTRRCLEDCIKVVIDHREDPEADTGMFECIHQQLKVPFHSEAGVEEIVIHGKGLRAADVFHSRRLATGMVLREIEPSKSMLQESAGEHLMSKEKVVEDMEMVMGKASYSRGSQCDITSKTVSGRNFESQPISCDNLTMHGSRASSFLNGAISAHNGSLLDGLEEDDDGTEMKKSSRLNLFEEEPVELAKTSTTGMASVPVRSDSTKILKVEQINKTLDPTELTSMHTNSALAWKKGKARSKIMANPTTPMRKTRRGSNPEPLENNPAIFVSTTTTFETPESMKAVFVAAPNTKLLRSNPSIEPEVSGCDNQDLDSNPVAIQFLRSSNTAGQYEPIFAQSKYPVAKNIRRGTLRKTPATPSTQNKWTRLDQPTTVHKTM